MLGSPNPGSSLPLSVYNGLAMVSLALESPEHIGLDLSCCGNFLLELYVFWVHNYLPDSTIPGSKGFLTHLQSLRVAIHGTTYITDVQKCPWNIFQKDVCEASL